MRLRDAIFHELGTVDLDHNKDYQERPLAKLKKREHSLSFLQNTKDCRFLCILMVW